MESRGAPKRLWSCCNGEYVGRGGSAGDWKSRVMVDRYAKFASDHLAAAARRIESGRGENVLTLSRFCHVADKAA